MSDLKYPHVWHWREKPGYDRGSMPRVFDRDRKGERFRVLARGAMNHALIEFEDGYRVVTSQGRALPAEALLRRSRRLGRRALHAVWRSPGAAAGGAHTPGAEKSGRGDRPGQSA